MEMKHNLKIKVTCPKCKKEASYWREFASQFIGFIFNSFWYECNHCKYRFPFNKTIIK
jgi:C4-type Zn-finger protein